MRDLNYDLKRLQAAHDDGSHGTRAARSYALAQIADTLHDLGFKGLRATGLRRKHVAALVREWKRQGRSIGTMKNRTAHIRWWAKHIGRPGVVPSNGALGIANREYVTNEDRSVVLDPDKLALVRDAHVAMALRLEAAFGLRREEAIKFTPARDDRGDRIRLKGSTTKGGRPREVPVLKDSQRKLLDEARRLAGSGALIPPDRNYRQQLKDLREPDAGGGPVPHAWAAARLCDFALRGDHGVEGTGGGRAVPAVADGGEAEDRRRRSAQDRGGTRSLQDRGRRSLRGHLSLRRTGKVHRRGVARLLERGGPGRANRCTARPGERGVRSRRRGWRRCRPGPPPRRSRTT